MILTGRLTDTPQAQPLLSKSVIFLLLGLFFTLTLRYFLAAGRDDTFIMLWAGQSLTFANGFVNYNFERQELASSLLASWITALTYGWPLDYALLAIKILGTLTSCLTLYLLGTFRYPIFTGLNPRLVGIAILIATACSPCFAYWSSGGLETPYHTLLLTLFALYLADFLATPTNQPLNPWPLAAVSAVLVLARSEAFWHIAIPLALMVPLRRQTPKMPALLIVTGIPLALLLATFLIRHHLTGQWWPNPVYAKVHVNADLLKEGYRYLAYFYTSSPWCYLLLAGYLLSLYKVGYFFLAGLLKKPVAADDRFLAVLGIVASGQTALIICIGGNWMEYFRFMVSITPLLNIAVFFGFYQAYQFLAHQGLKLSPILPIIALTSVALSQIGTAGNILTKSCATPVPLDTPTFQALAHHTIAGNCAHSRDWLYIKPFIEGDLKDIVKNSPNPVIIASYQAGFFPYMLRQHYTANEVQFIDTLGLTEKKIAKLGGERTSLGLSEGTRIDQALQTNATSPLHQFLQASPPSVVYNVIEMTPEMQDNYAKAGYRQILDKPSTFVFFKP